MEAVDVWDKVHVPLGNLKANNQTRTVTFKAKRAFEWNEINGMLDLKTSCGCTQAIWNPSTQTITAEIKVGPVPLHLIRDGHNSYNKRVTVRVGRKDRHFNKQIVKKDILAITFKAIK